MTVESFKGDRALELREKGIGRNEIAERLGVSAGKLKLMIERATKRRANKEKEDHSAQRQALPLQQR
jgi:orotate phosphoribosyltransferase-like protein